MKLLIYSNFGNFIGQCPFGNRMLNLEVEITAYQLAFQIYTRETFPENWAMTQNNLVLAYRDRMQGDRANNLELAIATAQLALQVYTRETFPEQWAWSQKSGIYSQ